MDFIFFKEDVKGKRHNIIRLTPTYNFTYSNDIIIKGGKVYAMYDEENKVWKKDKREYVKLMDRDLKKKYKEYQKEHPDLILDNDIKFDSFGNNSSGYFKDFNTFIRDMENILPEIDLDGKVIFKNMELEREDYSTGKLNYAIEKGSTEAWDTIVGTLYSPLEREKIEWMIGSIISGYSKVMQSHENIVSLFSDKPIQTITEKDTSHGEQDFRELLNPDSLSVDTCCYVEEYAAAMRPGDYLQFQRIGYFMADPDSTPEHPVFNKTVGLKDTWAKMK